jgi:hypothetical protein
MGRGLSDLQERMLLLALNGYQREERSPRASGADLYYADVFVAVYGWRRSPQSPYSCAGDHKFDRRAIGRRQYAAAQAAVSRAAQRLEKRGLATCLCGSISRWSGLNLTKAGIALAAKLKTATGSP